jgi:hypothetical protein
MPKMRLRVDISPGPAPETTRLPRVQNPAMGRGEIPADQPAKIAETTPHGADHRPSFLPYACLAFQTIFKPFHKCSILFNIKNYKKLKKSLTTDYLLYILGATRGG